ncbi:hypothetical protein [Paenibacillus shenyangensis]|uniref:hypothetical protein n=1 Tax=Paenibacillus sp. A9 TaxID=1284352 RepID=UPI0003701387|nr:hypothetical protein [Paenibacillus sp. A9]
MSDSFSLLVGALGGFIFYAVIIVAIIFIIQKRSKTSNKINLVPILLITMFSFSILAINRLMYGGFYFDILLALYLTAIMVLSFKLIQQIRNK